MVCGHDDVAGITDDVEAPEIPVGRDVIHAGVPEQQEICPAGGAAEVEIVEGARRVPAQADILAHDRDGTAEPGGGAFVVPEIAVRHARPTGPEQQRTGSFTWRS